MNMLKTKRNNYSKLWNLMLIVFLSSTISAFSQSKIRIACVGNSITAGARIDNPKTNSYPAQTGCPAG